jgi:hypothetical protein
MGFETLWARVFRFHGRDIADPLQRILTFGRLGPQLRRARV